MAKLTDEVVEKLKVFRAEGMTYKIISEILNVNIAQLCTLVNNNYDIKKTMLIFTAKWHARKKI